MQTSVVLMHFTIDPPDNIWHDTHAYAPNFLEAAYANLPNFYCISFIREASGNKAIVGGFFVRTQLHHQAPNFAHDMAVLASQLSRIEPRVNSATAIVPKPIVATHQVSETEMLDILADEFLRLTSAGSTTRQ
jgi:hypothetical protein